MASADAAKYAPDQLNDVQTKLDDLRPPSMPRTTRACSHAAPRCSPKPKAWRVRDAKKAHHKA